jgi:hypothetical protein
MSLNQKYTWRDFLREHPEHKEKKTKRTSPEGKKAFEAAFKAYVKKYLTAELPKKLEALEARIGKRRAAENTTVRELRKAKKFAKATIAQRRLGRSDRALAGIKKQKARAQAAAKNF